jgi:hypothetical protein
MGNPFFNDQKRMEKLRNDFQFDSYKSGKVPAPAGAAWSLAKNFLNYDLNVTVFRHRQTMPGGDCTHKQI